MTLRHFIAVAETPTDELNHIFDVSLALRAARDTERFRTTLAGKTVAMIFEKPSLRTRISFEAAIAELGAVPMVMGGGEVGLGKRESVGDVIRVLSGMVDGVVARVFEHQKLVDMAAHGSIPVINALSDYSHPCQALADAMTMMDEFGRDLSGRTVAFVGDGNNVARSLAIVAGKLGMNFILASPPGYELEAAFQDRIMSAVPGMNFEMTGDPRAAVAYADAIYTDTWVSMGQEEEKEKRLRVFGDYQVNQALLDAAPHHAIVLHCLPAYRGIEITDEVMDGPSSRVFPQAHNRLHAQKGLLAVLLGDA